MVLGQVMEQLEGLMLQMVQMVVRGEKVLVEKTVGLPTVTPGHRVV